MSRSLFVKQDEETSFEDRSEQRSNRTKDKQDRLSSALRDNLKKRKQQQRQRDKKDPS